TDSPAHSEPSNLSLHDALPISGYPELIPNDLAEHLIRFTGPPRTAFHPRPLFEIFVPEYWEHNYRSGELVRDKIVVIGAEGEWRSEEHTSELQSPDHLVCRLLL